MRLILCVLAAASAGLLAACGGGGGATKRDSAATTVKLDAIKGTDVDAGHFTSLRATIDRGGSPPVHLQADPYPFGRFRNAQTAKLDSGNAQFEAGPAVNTRYRVRVGDGESAAPSTPLTVYVHPLPRVQAGFEGGRVKVLTTVKVPAAARPKLGPAYFYARWPGSPRYVLLGTGKRYVATKGRVAASRIAPARADKGHFLVCVTNGWAAGIGRGVVRGCGKRSLRYP